MANAIWDHQFLLLLLFFFFVIHLDWGIYTKEKWTLLLHSRSTLCKQHLNSQHTSFFFVSCFSDPFSDHVAPHSTAGIIYLWLTQSFFFILAFGSWLPVGQVGVTRLVTQLAIWSSPKLAPQRSARPLLWNGFADFLLAGSCLKKSLFDCLSVWRLIET